MKIKIVILCLVWFSLWVQADFLDIEYSWYRESILDLQSQWLTQWYPDGNYGPQNHITRAEILTILLRANDIQIDMSDIPSCFPDVDTQAWYHPYICRAYAMGIANGFSDGNFWPDRSVTTLEALAFANKIFETGVLTQGEIWYTGLQEFSNTNNIIPNHSYTRDTHITRGKAADMIIRFQSYKKTKVPPLYKSSGCNKNQTQFNGEHTITVRWIERKYNLFVPIWYTNGKEFSLIVATHGRTNSKDDVQRYMGLEKGQSDVIVVYPAGLQNSTRKSYSWSEAENMVFIDALLQEVTENFCIQKNKIFVVWHSLGGWMSQKIACLRGEFIRALATVGSGGFTGSCTGPVGALMYQNTNDHLSSYASGLVARDARLKANKCDNTKYENISIGALTCTKYTACAIDSPVIWCEGYTGYNWDPHSWPTPHGWKDILDFFRTQQ